MNAHLTSVSPVTTEKMALFLKACADPLRLNVLQVLGHSSFGVLELSEILAIKQSGMSHHLKVLDQGGWVEKRREGNSIFYRRRLPDAAHPSAALHESVLAQLDAMPLDVTLAARFDRIQAQRAEQSKQFFARHAGQLSGQQELIADYPQYADLALDLLLRQCPQGGVVVEVGPGEGQFLLALSGHFGKVIGIDNSEALLAQAAQQLTGLSPGHVELMLGEWPDVHLSLPSVDALVFNMVLHHLPSPRAAIRAAAEQLKPGGALLITELSRHDQSWAQDACGDIWFGFEESDLVAWAQQSGLALQESQFLALRNGFQVQVRTFERISNDNFTLNTAQGAFLQ